jgi:outer membrane protein assembly factor BamB
LATDGERVLLATESGAIRAIDAVSGAALWETRIDPSGPLAATSGMAVAKHRNGTLTALDPTSGKTLWTTRTTAAGDLPPSLVDGRILAAGRAIALVDASGKKGWTTRGVGAFTTVPATAGSRVLAATQEGLVRCFFLITGEPMWEYRLAQPLDVAPVADRDGRVFLGTSDGWILCLSTSSGRRLWRWRIGARTAHAGVVIGSRYCVASYDAALHALDRRSGHLSWRSALPSRPLAPPLVRGDVIYVLCYGDLENRSSLVATEAASGRRIGVFDLAGEAVGLPLLIKDRFVFPLRDGTLVAFTPAVPASRPSRKAPQSGQPRGQPGRETAEPH